MHFTEKMKQLLALLQLCLVFSAGAQTPTVGLIQSSELANEGYSLFVTELTKEVYLIDNCGRMVKTWHFNDQPALTTYLLENGNVLLAGKDSLEIRDWNDNQVWSYATTDNGIRQHHDIQPLPNGNVLCIVSDPKTEAELLDAGRDPALLATPFRMDRLVELQPVGAHDALIVWEWRFWDHLIQDFDNTKNNFGIVADHPELINLNFDHGYDDDWSHLNSVDYDATLDQVLISSRNMCEIYIIDHSTTTQEAASHTGGNSGMGGDIIWRWGNPQVYRPNQLNTQRFQYQHDAKIIRDGSVNDGKISVFNNGGDLSGNFSSIALLEPVRNGFSYTMGTEGYLPDNVEHSWNGDLISPVINSNKKCGVQYFPNGHKLVCDTQLGRFIELDENDSIIWIYINPVYNNGIYNQFATPGIALNAAYRVHRYAPNYAPFIGQDLTAGSILEDVNSVSEACATASVEEMLSELSIVNPTVDGMLVWHGASEEAQVGLYNLQGSIQREVSGQSYMDVQGLPSAWYLLRVETPQSSSTQRVLILNP